MKKSVLVATAVLILAVLVSGLFADRSNPKVENEVQWDSASTRDQFIKSCADCHSNQTRWPWYAYVGPSAFLMVHNVEEGRGHFNISTRNMGESDDAAEEVMEGEMPPRDYLLLHPEAALSPEQMRSFAKGLRATFGGEAHGGHGGGEHHERD